MSALCVGLSVRLSGNFKLVRCKIRKTKFGREAEKKKSNYFGRQAEFFLEVRDLIRKIMHLTRKIIIKGAKKRNLQQPSPLWELP